MRSLYAVARNTMTETLRQNLFGLLLCLSAFLIIFSPAFAMFTFMDSTKLVQDMGLASILLTGLFLASFSAVNAISREIEDGTALTMISKPLSRESFLLGKFVGLVGAISIALYDLTIILLLTFRFGVKDTASTNLDWFVMASMVLAIVIALVIGLIQNFFFGRCFISSAVKSVTCTLSLVLLAFSFFSFDSSGGHYVYAGFGAGINWQIAIAAFLVLQAVLILVAVAVAVSTRLRVAATIGFSASFLFGGMLSEYLLGEMSKTHVLFRTAYALLPNMQLYWLTEGMVEGKMVPFRYVLATSGYTICYICAALFIGLFFFVNRDIRG